MRVRFKINSISDQSLSLSLKQTMIYLLCNAYIVSSSLSYKIERSKQIEVFSSNTIAANSSKYILEEMAAPKSILRTSSFRTKPQPKFVDDELSMFSSIMSSFKPPFMRSKVAAAIPDCIATSKQSDDRDDSGEQGELLCDQTEVSNGDVSDERLNMSVTFDQMHKDDISTGVTFDLDHKEPLPASMPEEPIEQSLEITFENYVEYEALKRKRRNRVNIMVEPKPSADESTEMEQSTGKEEENSDAEAKLKEELEALRKLKEKVEEEKRLEALKAKLEEEMKQKAFTDKIRKEAELVEKLRQRVADVKEATRAKKAEVELKRAREELEKNKTERVSAAPKIQERLQSTVDRLAAANTAQDLLEVDVAKILARASHRDANSKLKSVVVPLSDNSKRLLAPPPVKEKLQLPDNYKYNLDLDAEPLGLVERFEYESAHDSDNASLDSSEKESSYRVISRPGYVKPAPTSPRSGFF